MIHRLKEPRLSDANKAAPKYRDTNFRESTPQPIDREKRAAVVPCVNERICRNQFDCCLRFLSLAHRTLAAFRAISWRFSEVIFLSRAFPPSWPNWTACGFLAFFSDIPAKDHIPGEN
jgi:hypothetical protein